MENEQFVKGPDGRIHIAGISLTGDSATLCGLFTDYAAQGGFDGELGIDCTWYKRATPTCESCLKRVKEVLDIADIRTLRKWIK